VKYYSTRDTTKEFGFEETLLHGLAHDGGLYLPKEWPSLDNTQINRLKNKPYTHVAASLMKSYAYPEISEDDIARLVHATYSPHFFKHPAIAPLVQIDTNLWIMELFHGPTLAFKDYALQLLGNLFDYTLEKRGERVTIVGATSGDTGSAAIEACAGSKNIDIFILHPKDRTSEVQRKQMTTVDSPNVHNIALEGTFDDCQAAVKELFADAKFRQDMNLSAVNSINWARICSQIVYYVYGSLALGTAEKPVSFAVPTGNFGNVFAAYCAHKMGIPIDKLIIGTNDNDILTRFFETGKMQKGKVVPTISPSMDIQISSNFERYLFELTEKNTKTLTDLMQEFKTKGSFSVSDDMREQAQKDFTAHRCNTDETLKTIEKVYDSTGYILDPHTAVGVHAAMQEKENCKSPIIALACAHPAKFPDAVKKAIGRTAEIPERLERVMSMPEFMTPMPPDIAKLKTFIRQHVKR
jgi:threonine synthase